MHISHLKRTDHGIEANVSCSNPVASFPGKMYFQWEPCFLDNIEATYDPFVLALIPVAQLLGEDITLSGDMDVDLHENALEAISLYNAWYGERAKIINIIPEALCMREHRSNDAKIASFYSGGVDSLFNIAMKRNSIIANQIKYGIVVKGMDIPVDDTLLWPEVKKALTKNVKHLEYLEPVFIETNARDFQKCGVSYTDNGFGPILGAISNLIASNCRKVLVGSYGLYKDLEPHASGPLIDRLWSSSRHSVIHYSPRFDRLSKIKHIGNIDKKLLCYLRVCWKNPHGSYNCGICEKCLRTKMELRLSGNTNSTLSFPEYDIMHDIKYIIGQIPVDSYSHLFWQNIRNLEVNSYIKRCITRALYINSCERILTWGACAPFPINSLSHVFLRGFKKFLTVNANRGSS